MGVLVVEVAGGNAMIVDTEAEVDSSYSRNLNTEDGHKDKDTAARRGYSVHTRQCYARESRS